MVSIKNLLKGEGVSKLILTEAVLVRRLGFCEAQMWVIPVLAPFATWLLPPSYTEGVLSSLGVWFLIVLFIWLRARRTLLQ